MQHYETKLVQEFLVESVQKNEDSYKYIDDVPTREIAKALKELGIKEPYATQKAKIADKLAKYFGLRSVPTAIEMVEVLNALPYFTETDKDNNETTDADKDNNETTDANDFYKSLDNSKEALELILAFIEKREYVHAKDLIKALISKL